MRYLVIVEQTRSGYSAYSPDLDGCVATGATRAEVEDQMREAIELHLDALRQGGGTIPSPKAYSTYVDVPAEER